MADTFSDMAADFPMAVLSGTLSIVIMLSIELWNEL